MKVERKESLELIIVLTLFAVLMLLGGYGYLGSFMQEFVRSAIGSLWYYWPLLTVYIPKNVLMEELIQATPSGKRLPLIRQELQKRALNPPPEAIMDSIKNGCLTVNQKELRVSKAFYGRLTRYLPPNFATTLFHSEKSEFSLTALGIQRVLKALERMWHDYHLAPITQEFLTYLVLLSPEQIKVHSAVSALRANSEPVEVWWICDTCGSIEPRSFSSEDLDLEGLQRRTFPCGGAIYFGCILCEKCLQDQKKK